jgi:plasmid rolling circle replication initiator protein Rep
MRWLFITLTIKNCAITELRDTLNNINYGFRKLSRRKAFPGVGWIKSVEVTRGRDGKTAHPHLHILMMVKPSYFGKRYLSQQKWCDLWQSCMKLDYQPILDIQAVKPNKSPTVLISEVIKYQTKESDLIRDPQWFAEYVKQMHKSRAISVGGILQDYFKKLEEEPEDLIGESDEDEVDEGHLRFGWKRREKKYRMVE